MTAKIDPKSVVVMYRAARFSCPGAGRVMPTPQMNPSLTISVNFLMSIPLH